MHTVKVMLVGFALLAACFLLGRWLGAGTAVAMKFFLVLWLIGTAINMWIGVHNAGYSVKDEAPIALVIFAVPAVTAILIGWRLAKP